MWLSSRSTETKGLNFARHGLMQKFAHAKAYTLTSHGGGENQSQMPKTKQSTQCHAKDLTVNLSRLLTWFDGLKKKSQLLSDL